MAAERPAAGIFEQESGSGAFLPANAVRAPRRIEVEKTAPGPLPQSQPPLIPPPIEVGGGEGAFPRGPVLPLTRRIVAAIGVSAMTVSAMVFAAGALFGLSLQIREAPFGDFAVLSPLSEEVGQAATGTSTWVASAAAGLSAMVWPQDEAVAAVPAASGIAVPPPVAEIVPAESVETLLPLDSFLAAAPARPAGIDMAPLGTPLNDDLATPPVALAPTDLEGPVPALSAPQRQAPSIEAEEVLPPPPTKPEAVFAQAEEMARAAALRAQREGPYMVQLGAFRNALNARELAERAEALGLGAVVLERLNGSQTSGLHAVRLAGFSDRAAARAAQEVLIAEGFEPGMILGGS